MTAGLNVNEERKKSVEPRRVLLKGGRKKKPLAPVLAEMK